MTKQELIKALERFPDDIEVVVQDREDEGIDNWRCYVEPVSGAEQGFFGLKYHDYSRGGEELEQKVSCIRLLAE